MIDFIVLGIIPGTTFQIQITHIMFIAWAIFMFSLVKSQLPKSSNVKQSVKKALSLKRNNTLSV